MKIRKEGPTLETPVVTSLETPGVTRFKQWFETRLGQGPLGGKDAFQREISEQTKHLTDEELDIVNQLMKEVLQSVRHLHLLLARNPGNKDN